MLPHDSASAMHISRLKLRRQLVGLRQLDLSRLTGISESRLTKLETLRLPPRPEELERLAEVLGVDPALLVERKEPDHE
jgi:transcriptional regulator with XRE-family HTH domain